MEDSASVQNLFAQKLENCKKFFADEIFEARLCDKVDLLDAEQCVIIILSNSIFWPMIEAGDVSFFLVLAKNVGDEDAERACNTYERMSDAKKKKLHDYVNFFLACVKELTGN